jgi:hypothetical protein
MSFAAAVLAATLCFVGGGTAFAGQPGVEHFTEPIDDMDTNFCGTGETVIVTGEVTGTAFTQPNQDVDYWEVTRGFVTLTSPDTGLSVTLRWANRFTDVVISGDEEGIHTHRFTVMGLPEQFKLPNGGVITLDAGLIVLENIFEGDEFLSSEITFVAGPHPAAESGFELFCQVIPAALGL